MRYLLVALLLLSTTNAYAWKEVGGGDDVGIEFETAFFTALATIEKSQSFGDLDVNALRHSVDEVQVVVVDGDLPVPAGGSDQDSVATNDPTNLVIRVSRARWRAITNPRVKESIALHEALSLEDIEHTGIYTYSARYLEIAGRSPGGDSDSYIPRAKTLHCAVDYFAPHAKKQEHYEFKKKLETENRRQPWRLIRDEKYVTANGRFKVDMWGVQPYGLSNSIAAFEFTGISIQDTKLNAIQLAGRGAPGGIRQNEDHTHLTVLLDHDEDSVSSITAECSLTDI